MTQAAPQDIALVDTAHGPMWVFKSDIYVSRSLSTYGEYVHAENEVFSQIVKPGMTVVEVGANIGAHAVTLARACAPGPYYGFEPQQRVFQVLTANAVINGITNALLYPEAIGDREGMMVIDQPDYSAAGNFGSVSLDSKNQQPRRRLPVRVSKLDSWGLSACHLLKIDVEGWECQVIEGAKGTISKHRPIIYTENDRAKTQGQLIEMIAGLNYKLYWHVAPMFRQSNFKGVTENVFGNTASLNMLCMPIDRNIPVNGLPEIDPAGWKSPFPAIGA